MSTLEHLRDHDAMEDVRKRFLALYVAAVSDVLDKHGYRSQVPSLDLKPLTPATLIAGPAFTVVGGPVQEPGRKRLGPGVIDSFTPGVVACYDTMGSTLPAAWGELWTTGAVARGCVGAIVDGGIRDTARMNELGFSAFYRFRSPIDAAGRLTVLDFDCPVNIGGVRVKPGDYVFGDMDGLVVVPRDLTIEVLVKAEELAGNERKMRSRLQDGESPGAIYEQMGYF